MRMCISGGAPPPAEVKQRFEKATGAAVVEAYGLTESRGVVSCNPSSRNKAGTLGQPLPGTIVRLVDKAHPTRPPPDGQPRTILSSDERRAGPPRATPRRPTWPPPP